jgi:hypothetical protein
VSNNGKLRGTSSPSQIEQARELWVETFCRDRADVGPGVAAQRAADETSRYASHDPLEVALADLRAAWTVEADTRNYIGRALTDRDRLREFLTVKAEQEAALTPLDDARWQTHQAADRACTVAEQVSKIVDAEAGRHASQLQGHLAEARPAVREAGRMVLDRPGRLGPAVALLSSSVTRATVRFR